MEKRKIAVICGGDSSEREVSLKSGKAIYNWIKEDFDATLIDLSKKGWTTLGDGYEIDKNDFSYTDKKGNKHCFDFALIAIHGTPGENGPLQGYFDLISMPYSSCSQEVSTVTFNKFLTKRLVQNIKGYKIGLAKDILLQKGEKYDADEIISKLSLPLFVKPNSSGSSCGVTKVKTKDELNEAITEAFKESPAVIMEEFVQGREIGQGVLVINEKSFILPITELITSREFFDYTAKYTPGATNEVTPADLPEDLKDKIGEMSLEIYKILGCSGIVRVDYIIKNRTPYFIEINTVPGMTENSILPAQFNHMNIKMSEIWRTVIESHFYKKS